MSQWRRERLGDANLLYRNASITGLVSRVLRTPDEGDARHQLNGWFRSYDGYLQYDRMDVFDATGALRVSLPLRAPPSATISADGDDVLFLNDLRFAPGAALRLRVPLTKPGDLSVGAVLGETGTLEDVDYRGTGALGVARAIPDSP